MEGSAGLAGHRDQRDQHAEDQVGGAILAGPVGILAQGWVSQSLGALHLNEKVRA